MILNIEGRSIVSILSYRDYKNFLRKYMLLQIEAYETSAGWFFWTAKTENHTAPEWDYLFLLENGVAPQNLCAKENLCSDKSNFQ